jgi:tRNA(Ile)-lysidine synthase
MAGPDPAVAAVRSAVRAALLDTPPGSLSVAAVSGGPDSLALLAGLAWEAPRHDRRAAAITVDHQMQPGSKEQAMNVVAQSAALGVECTCAVAASTRPSEEQARRSRYRYLDRHEPGATIMLGHTLDDQAEQVLLGLARGSGARSLSGMPRVRGRYVRPLLDLPRAVTVRACEAQGLTPWHDPMNADSRYARARVRRVVLPLLEDQLGPGITEALARTAKLLRDDADLLDALASEHTSLATDDLAALPPALRSRVLRREAIAAGARPTDLTAGHVESMDALVTNWHGQGAVDLPGGLAAVRRCDTLAFVPRPQE